MRFVALNNYARQAVLSDDDYTIGGTQFGEQLRCSGLEFAQADNRLGHRSLRRSPKRAITRHDIGPFRYHGHRAVPCDLNALANRFLN